MYGQADCTKVESLFDLGTTSMSYLYRQLLPVAISVSNIHCILPGGTAPTLPRDHNGSVGGTPPSTQTVLMERSSKHVCRKKNCSIHGLPLSEGHREESVWILGLVGNPNIFSGNLRKQMRQDGRKGSCKASVDGTYGM